MLGHALSPMVAVAVDTRFAPFIGGLTAQVVDDDLAAGVIDLSQTSDVGLVLVPFTDPTPSAAQIMAGQDASGQTAAAAVLYAATVEGTADVVFDLPATLNGNYKLCGAAKNAEGLFSNVVSTGPLALNTIVTAGPEIVAAGPANGTGQAQTASFPDYAAGDMRLVAFVSRFSNTPPAAPAGWTQLTTASYDASSGEDLNLGVYWQIAATDNEPDPVFADVGAVNFVAPFVVRGGANIAAIGSGGGQATGVSISGGATVGPNELVVDVIGNRISGQTTSQLSGAANASLDGFAGAFAHQQSNPQQGVGINILAGTKASAGVVDPTTATLAASAPWAAVKLRISA